MSPYEWAVLNGFLIIIRFFNVFLHLYIASKGGNEEDSALGDVFMNEYESMLKQIAGK